MRTHRAKPSRLGKPSRLAEIVRAVLFPLAAFCLGGALNAQVGVQGVQAGVQTNAAPVYLEKYTISKIYLEGAEQLSRNYIFRYLPFRRGDSYTPAQLQRLLADTRHTLRSQWYFQADFDPHYYPDGRVELYVLLQPSPRRFGFLGASADGHSFYLGFSGHRASPGSAFRLHLGKWSGLSLYLPYLSNTVFGINLLAEVQPQGGLQRLHIAEAGNTVFWLRSGLEEFIQPTVALKFGLAQQYWATLPLSGGTAVHEIVLSALAELNNRYLLQSQFWGMELTFRADLGLSSGLLRLHSRYKLALLPVYWLELDAELALSAQLLPSSLRLLPNLPILQLDTEAAGGDFHGLSRLRSVFLFSHNSYDNQTEFNWGLAAEGKFGLSAAIFTAKRPVQLGVEVQAGLVLDVLTPGAFTTRFVFFTGMSITLGLPVAELLVESRF